MTNAIAFEIKGIKCDNDDCDYHDDDIDFDPIKFLNAPCPKCGSNLFTEEDAALMKNMLGMVDIINAVAAGSESFQRLVKEAEESHGKQEPYRYSVDMDGSGTVKSVTRKDDHDKDDNNV